MRIYILILLMLLLRPSHFLAQQKEICAEVQYTQVVDFRKPVAREFKLVFNNSFSLYEEQNLEQRSRSINKKEENGRQVLENIVGRSNMTPEFYYNNRKDFYFMEVWFDEELVVEEDFKEWNWQIEEEQKKIGRFTCQKATIDFRGRKYIAWFTNEIPVSFGPWKFQGLMGLILEVYEEDYVFHIRANQIELNRSMNCNMEFDPSILENPLTIEKFLQKRRELAQEDMARLSSRLPKGSKNQKLNFDCEGCGSQRVEIFD